MTPEAKVKAKIHALLKAANAYAVNYIGGQYATSGTPDILACLQGRFIAIEAKAGKGKPTALQLRALRLIDEAGGVALIINETNFLTLEEALHEPRRARSNYQLFERKEKAADPEGAAEARLAKRVPSTV